MIVVTKNQKEIRKFTELIRNLALDIREGRQEKTDQDGSLLSLFPEGQYAGELGIWDSAAIGGRTSPIGYSTGSGYGKYFISLDPITGKPMLVFQGRRNSFKCGAGFLRFYPSSDGEWTILESDEPNRGPFD